MSRRILLTLALILSLLLAACGGETATPTAEPTEAAAPEATATSAPEAESEAEHEAMEEPMVTNAVTVADQELGAGNTVTIAGVTADVAGWLVIHAQADGAPGPILGYAPVAAGDNADVVVTIDPAGATETLYAMLHVDAGTPGEYEFPGDDGPAKDADGNVVTPPFALTIPNSVTAADQELGAGNTVTIAGITAAVPGWLVIHAQADGAPGPILGYAPVAAGFNEDVVVTIDAAGATETVYAMLHVDAGTPGEYEFPGDDGPAKDADGNVVTPPFALTIPNSVSVSDQALGAGNSVTIDSVTAAVAGWIVIHTQADGAPGPIVGYAPVAAGENSAVVVNIDAARATETLYAMLHVDAGVAGEYEFPGDDGPARDADDNVVTPPFNLDLEGVNAVSVADQALGEGDTVTIAFVRAAVPGWLVIHAQTEDGKPGPILGYAAVSAGLNTDVVVTIDAAGATETLYAMLHVDAGVAGEYEFPGDDGPAMDLDGNVVTPPFVLLTE